MRTGPKPRNIDMAKISPVEDPKVSYLLGFLWADGYVFKTGQGSVRIGAENWSEDILELDEVFKTVGKWNVQSRQRHGRRHQTAYNCFSRPFYEWLADRNYTKKAIESAEKVLTDIPNNLHHYWFRGYFDGDGNLYRLLKGINAQVTLAGSINQDWSVFEKIIDSLGCTYTIAKTIKSKSESSTLRLTGRENTLTFLDYIYSGNEFGLSRKYQAYKKYSKDVASLRLHG